MRARRALLYMPGDDLHKIQKATNLDVDCVCMDMEDGVAYNRKKEARETIVEALNRLDFGRSERLARINAVGSGLESEDLEAVLPAGPDGIVVPKVESPDQVHWVAGKISQAEEEQGFTPGEIAIIAIVETALGIIHLSEIASAEARLAALIFGAEDYAGDVGALRTPANTEVLFARSAIVAYSGAYNLQAIDIVYTDFHDPEGLRQEALQGAQLGFSGKQIIHPDQIAPVQEAFTPSDEAIQNALRIMAAFEKHQQAGRGAFALDGKMVDAPIVKSAARVLERARAAGKILAP